MMQEIKRFFIGIILAIFVLAGGLTLLVKAGEFLIKAALWLVYIDNSETGLPFIAEIIIKAICETCVVGLCSSVFIIKNKELLKILSIPLGFLTCIGIYAICKYIIIICSVLVLTMFVVIVLLINNKKK